jgi:hypothetical protein
MRSAVGFTLGISALLQITVASASVAQAADPHACTYFQASDVLKITGRKDVLGQGPQASKPGETLAGTTECDFLSVSMTVTSNMTPAWFARDKATLENSPYKWKVESVSGLGDEAYYMWDPRPGSNRNVGIVYRAGGKRVSVGELAASADSIQSAKQMLMQIAKLALPKLK